MVLKIGNQKVTPTILKMQERQNAIIANGENYFTLNKNYIFDITGKTQSQNIVIGGALNSGSYPYSWQGDNVTIICPAGVTGGTKSFYLLMDSENNGNVILKLVNTQPQVTPFAKFKVTTYYDIESGGYDNYLNSPVVYRPSGYWVTDIYT